VQLKIDKCTSNSFNHVISKKPQDEMKHDIDMTTGTCKDEVNKLSFGIGDLSDNEILVYAR